MVPQPLEQFRSTHPAKSAQIGGTRWEYWAGGAGARGLLILGGGLTFGETNFHLISRFETARRVISPSYPPLPTIGALVDGLVRLLDEEQIPRTDVLGQGLGAALAHVLLRLHPDRVNRVALCDFGLYSRTHRFAAHAALQAIGRVPVAAIRAWNRRLYRRLTEHLQEPERSNTRAIVAQTIRKQSRESTLRRVGLLTELFDNAADYQVNEPVDRPGRVLLTFADDDRSFSRKERRALMHAYPTAAIRRFSSGGNLVGLTRLDEIERELDAFFLSEPPQEITVH